MSNYPEFYIPSFFRGSNNNYYVDLPARPSEPKKVYVEDKRNGFFSFILIFIIIDLIIIISFPHQSGIFIFILIFLIYLHFNTIETENKIYEKEKNEANKKYESEIYSYNHILEKIKRYDNYNKKISSILETEKPDINSLIKEMYIFNEVEMHIEKGKHGFAENSFYVSLKEKFGDKIKRDYFIESNSFKKVGYYPDFIYEDKINSIYIDIEIDEPYSFDSREPIHYIDCDNERNLGFLKIGWIIVRFAEYQIVTDPAGCIATLERFISWLNKENDEMKVYIKKNKKWSKEEAIEFEKEKFREKYLNG